MSDAVLSIAATDRTLKRKIFSFVVLVVLSLIIGTGIRVSLLIIYPLVVVFILAFYRFRITASFLLLLALVCICFTASLFGGIFIRYKLLSLFYMLPFLLLLFCHPLPDKNAKPDQLSIFMTSLSIVAFINDVIGLFQIIRNPNSDDSFIGLYSDYSTSINGLMLLNSVLFFYYFVRFLITKKLAHLLPALFFAASAMLGFYGAGLVILFVAFVMAFLRFRIIAVLKTVAIGLVALGLIVLTMYLVKPLALEYNIANIKKLLVFNPETGARKVTSFYNYGISYPKNAKDFLLGSGPGTFNSRSAFMVGSPSYFNRIAFIKDTEQPYYFKNFAYTLWNENNTQKALFLDGFRNQPFSSVLAFLGEYGLIFTLAFSLLYLIYYKMIAKIFYHSGDQKAIFVHFKMFKFLMIFLPLLLLIDNYLEYPETIILIVLTIKLAHAGIVAQKLKTE
jgi:hypothetical protein